MNIEKGEITLLRNQSLHSLTSSAIYCGEVGTNPVRRTGAVKRRKEIAGQSRESVDAARLGFKTNVRLLVVDEEGS